MPYEIPREQLVRLLALEAAHTTLLMLGEEGTLSDQLLAESEQILRRIGVDHVTEFNEEVGVELARLRVGGWQ